MRLISWRNQPKRGAYEAIGSTGKKFHIRGVADRIVVHPHRLRHTFGVEFRARSGSDTETAAALGYTGLRYVGRYVRQSQQERETALEETFFK